MTELDGPKPSASPRGPVAWSVVLLGFAFVFAWTFADQVHDALRPVPTLSSTGQLAFELDESHAQLVDVVGFRIDCANATSEGERLIAFGHAPDIAAPILIAFEDEGDCREIVTEHHSRFRAKVMLAPAELRAELALEEFAGRELALVEPHVVEFWPLVAVMFFGPLGGFVLGSAFATRKLLRAEPAIADEALEGDDRPIDPYRAGKATRLITETIAPAPAFLAEVGRRRMISLGSGIASLTAALAWASWHGASIHQHDQQVVAWVTLALGGGGLLLLGVVLVVSGFHDRRREQATTLFEDPREGLLELIRSEPRIIDGIETGAVTHHFRVRDSQRNWAHFVHVNKPGPLFLDDAKTLALALYHPRSPDYLLVLSEDLHELDRPTFSPAQLRARYR